MSDSAVANLLGRLEQVASRLEAVERQLASGGGSSGASSSGAAAPQAAGGAGNAKSVADFDALVAQYIDKYVELSASIAPIVKQQADLVKEAVAAHRQLLHVASQSKKPSNEAFAKLLAPFSVLTGKVVEIRDKNRASPHFNHLSTLSEGIPAFGWVGVSPTPGPHVDESRASSEFYSNKILMQYRHDQSEAGKTNVAWVAAWNTFLKELRQWIKTYHTTGLTWSGQADASSVGAGAGAGSAPAPPSGGPPPPGPPPPMVMDLGSAAPKADAAAALFAEINAVRDRQKGGKTEGLRHVTKDMKTKNIDPSTAPAVVPKKAAAPAAKKAAPAQTRPAKLALEGNKWVVEFQHNNREVVIDELEAKQTVYIYKCENSVVHIKGKVNAITIDSCKKTAIVFESAIAAVEIVNGISIQVQINGKVPSILVDKTSGCQLFLSNDCLDVEIVTSKSDEMNVVLPGKTASDDIEEIAIPEQFKTVVKNRKLVTEAVAHV